MTNTIGHQTWAIAEGYIPEGSQGPKPQMESHETVCILNTTQREATIQITVYFSDRDPVGPFEFEVSPQRTRHVRFNELEDPEPIPKGTDYASVIESSVPVVVHHSRLDSRQSENALMSAAALGID